MNICFSGMKMSFIHFIHNKVWILWITYAQWRKEKKYINSCINLKYFFGFCAKKALTNALWVCYINVAME